MDKILPEDVSRVIYLDGDVIVNDIKPDVLKIINTNLHLYLIVKYYLKIII